MSWHSTWTYSHQGANDSIIVFAKLFADPLERRLEAQAFSRGEIGGYDDVQDFLIGHSIDVDATRQPTEPILNRQGVLHLASDLRRPINTPVVPNTGTP
jgi:hypothetical protein